MTEANIPPEYMNILVGKHRDGSHDGRPSKSLAKIIAKPSFDVWSFGVSPVCIPLIALYLVVVARPRNPMAERKMYAC